MANGIVIRRLHVDGLAPRDHPAPNDLAGRLADAARKWLPGALADAARDWSGTEVLRIRRLDVDISMMAAFDPEAFSKLLARAIVAALRQAETKGSAFSDDMMAYSTRAAYVAALVEALAAGRAADSWWLRDAEGLRFLSRPTAIRTALLADPEIGIEALASLPPGRLAPLLSVLGQIEADRVLDGFAAVGVKTVSGETCVAAVAGAANESDGWSWPLALYLRACAMQPDAAGPQLAAAVRAWSQMASPRERPLEDAAASQSEQSAASGAGTAALAALPLAARLALERSFVQRRDSISLRADTAPAPFFSRFGGLLLLWPKFPMAEITEAVANPETAALIAFAALGLNAGGLRFRAWLDDVPWRELFGLDQQISSGALAEGLAAIPQNEWESIILLSNVPGGGRDARFLRAPRALVGSRVAARGLAGLAHVASARFARRLIGFGDASASFLWDNLLGSGAVLLRGGAEWEARLNRPPLDVVLSLSRIAEGVVALPSGNRVRIARVAA